MKLDYGTQISYDPVRVSIGEYTLLIKKPLLRDVSELTFGAFSFYEQMLLMTPERYYTVYLKDTSLWESLPDEKKDMLTMYSIIQNNEDLLDIYINIFKFFFVCEDIVFNDGIFLVVGTVASNDDGPQRSIIGVINENIYPQVLSILKQLCGISSDEEEVPEKTIKFKNNAAKKLFERIKKAKKKAAETKKLDINLTLPNIISSVASRHPSINYTNIWDLTIFQLLDCFNRLQSGAIFDIDATRVSVWGDEKKSFDIALWYKNEYDKRSDLI